MTELPVEFVTSLARGSPFQRQSPCLPWMTYWYCSPAFAPGTSSEKLPLGSRLSSTDSQLLKSPATCTRWALGAQTRTAGGLGRHGDGGGPGQLRDEAPILADEVSARGPMVRRRTPRLRVARLPDVVEEVLHRRAARASRLPAGRGTRRLGLGGTGRGGRGGTARWGNPGGHGSAVVWRNPESVSSTRPQGCLRHVTATA